MQHFGCETAQRSQGYLCQDAHYEDKFYQDLPDWLCYTLYLFLFVTDYEVGAGLTE